MNDKAMTIKEADVIPVEFEPVSAVERMINNGVDPAILEKFMALQERVAVQDARKAYISAMAAFKRNPPDIEKDQKVSYKQTAYSHASLHNVTSKINGALSEHGLSAGWETTQEDGGITVKCTITHEMGHSESTALTAGADTSGSKNSIQAIGSTISYLQRYTILALTGLATKDMDDDGNGGGAPLEFVTEKQAIQISEMAEAAPGGMPKFEKYLNSFNPRIESVERIPAKAFEGIFNILTKAIKK